MSDLAALTISIRLDGLSGAVSGLDRLTQSAGRTQSTSSSLKKWFDDVGMMAFKFNQVVQTAAMALSLLGQALQPAIQQQTMQAQLEVLTRSSVVAKELQQEWTSLAAKTPLQSPEIAQAGRSLMAFGESADTVTDTVRRLGDVSSAIGAPLNEIAQIYGKVRVQGRVMAEDINQFQGRGIPLVQALARAYGTTEQEIKKMVTAGKIGFPDVERAFQSMTNEGGMFHGMMDKMSQTVEGKLSTAMDNWNLLLARLGKEALPAAAGALDVFSSAMGKALDLLGVGVEKLDLQKWDLRNPFKFSWSEGNINTANLETLNKVLGAINEKRKESAKMSTEDVVWLNKLDAAVQARLQTLKAQEAALNVHDENRAVREAKNSGGTPTINADLEAKKKLYADLLAKIKDYEVGIKAIGIAETTGRISAEDSVKKQIAEMNSLAAVMERALASGLYGPDAQVLMDSWLVKLKQGLDILENPKWTDQMSKGEGISAGGGQTIRSPGIPITGLLDREGPLKKEGFDSSETKEILAMADAWGIADAQAASFANTMKEVNQTMRDLSIQGIAQGFNDVGAALASGESGAAAFGKAMLDMGIQMTKQIGQALILAGVNALIPPLGNWMNPVGWALIAAGGGLAMAGGALGAMTETKATSTQSVNDAIITKDGKVIETHPDDNIFAFKELGGAAKGGSSDGPISIQIVNNSGVQVEAEATEKKGPNGRELMVVLKPMVKSLIASGELDDVAGSRWGTKYQGKSAS